MIWLTWRQFRAQAITAAVALAAFAIILVVTESHLSGLYDTSRIVGCHGAACVGAASNFLQNLSSGNPIFILPSTAYVILYFLSVLAILLAPAFIGAFWGAPLIARELEAGTFRLTWNQSVTRTRWLTVKLALVGVAAMVVTEAFSLIQAWWAAPIGKAVGLGGSASIFSEDRFGWFIFPSHGITPLGYAAFGVALGVTVGLLIGRLIPAMAITVAIFAAVQFITPLWIRPHLFPASQTVATIQAAGATVIARDARYMAVSVDAVPGQPGAWIMSSGLVSTGGQPVSTVPAVCQSAVPIGQSSNRWSALTNCLANHGARVTESYQPVSHYWPLQWSETAMFLALALALAWYCFWRLNRRRT